MHIPVKIGFSHAQYGTESLVVFFTHGNCNFAEINDFVHVGSSLLFRPDHAIVDTDGVAQ